MVFLGLNDKFASHNQLLHGWLNVYISLQIDRF